jgi:CRISPR type III-A-associated RAMP protein Csm4
MSTVIAEPALLVRLRPTGPWRIGGDNGRSEEVQVTMPSDRVYSAVTLAMRSLGQMEEWLEVTSGGQVPMVRFSSMFPYFGKQLYAPPPVTLWPPAQASAKMNWQAAKLIPTSVIDDLLAGEPFREDRWEVDGLSGCLLPAGSQALFRRTRRATAPVDRVTGASDAAYATTALEFNQGVGLWLVAVYASDAAQDYWDAKVRAAFRLLADSGFGGERSRGWGRSEQPEFQVGEWPTALVNHSKPIGDGESGYWLLSNYIPHPVDAVDWKSGFYELRLRQGRVDGSTANGELKKAVNMVREGSVVVADARPRGIAVNVAPEGASHPVWRSGFAVAAAIPWRAPSFQLPVHAAKAEPVRKKAEPEVALADVYLYEPTIVEEANVVEEPVIVEQPRYVEDGE